MDRWSIVTTLNYLPHDKEVEIVAGQGQALPATTKGREIVNKMVRVADMTRSAFMNGDLSTVMSPRTVITWAENAEIFNDVGFAFRLTFLNKCDELERAAGRRVLPARLRRGAAGERGQRRSDADSGRADGRSRRQYPQQARHRGRHRRLQARRDGLHARRRRRPRSGSRFLQGQAGPGRPSGAAARPAQEADRATTSASPAASAIPWRCRRGLPRFARPCPLCAGGPPGPRHLRRGRAGPRRGDRRRAPWPAWPTTSPRCSRTSTAAPTSPMSPTRTMRRSRRRSR